MRVLELFKGTGSITKYYQDTDIEVISLDILKKYKPTICCDIMDFDYKKYPVGYFDIIWASPECRVFSVVQYSWIGRKWKDREELEKARNENSMYIEKTIEIIDYLNPTYYFIENPLYSSIWNYVSNKYINKFVVVDYCYFGYDYKKPTKILTNKELENKRCNCKRHIYNLCRGGETDNYIKDPTNTAMRYSIPQKLLEYLLN